MAHSITGIDHCVILVRQLDAARDTIARLGFTLTPRGVHSDHMGTHNHCIMLRHGYFEVLSVLEPTQENARWRNVLARREGLNAVALATEDARKGHDELRANGVDIADPVDFARPVDNPGAKGEATFTVPGKLLLLEDQHLPAVHRQDRSRRRPCGTPSHDQRIVNGFGAHRSLFRPLMLDA